jgi:hypothetical protein
VSARDGLFLRHFSCTIPFGDTARVSSGVAGQRLPLPQQPGHSQVSQRSSQAAVAWLRSAGGTTHIEPTLLETPANLALPFEFKSF